MVRRFEVFLFKQKTAYEMRISDWSSDVCSFDLMVYASVRSGPSGGSRLVSADEKAAGALRGVVKVIQEERWIAVVGESWWAANRALNVLKPRFETRGRLADSAAISKALQNAFDDGPSADAANTGDVEKLLGGKNVISASYDVPMLEIGRASCRERGWQYV